MEERVPDEKAGCGSLSNMLRADKIVGWIADEICRVVPLGKIRNLEFVAGEIRRI